jgi:hypothetical protein
MIKKYLIRYRNAKALIGVFFFITVKNTMTGVHQANYTPRFKCQNLSDLKTASD